MTKPFIHEDFLLDTPTARRLFHGYANHQPILDYHNHLPPKEIAEDHRFSNLTEIWLGGDHYKWRALRADGQEERGITGNGSDYEKFLAWAHTAPNTLRNPLFHWNHLELKRYFEIDESLNETTAPRIWERANAVLALPETSVHGILEKFKVAALCTTDDPADPLTYHEAIATSSLKTRVYPAFRPDKAMAIHQAESFNAWTDRLAKVSDTHIGSLQDFETALRKRHDAFHNIGGRLSDHGLAKCVVDFPTEVEAAKIFDDARAGRDASPEAHTKFASHLMLFFGRLDSEKGWTKQLHLGPIRNVSTRRFRELGPDTGFDSIGDERHAQPLASYLDRLDQEDALPKMVIYNNNPNDNYVFSTMAGNFPAPGIRGKVQFGSGWWYLDAKPGIEWQLDALSNNGLLANFIGMLTDSRSFMSFPRHEYFRRVLCNLLGGEIERGLLPNDEPMIGKLVENICFHNAKRFLDLAVGEEFGS